MGRPKLYADDATRVRAFRIRKQIEEFTAQESRDHRDRQTTVDALNALFAAEPIQITGATEPGTVADGMQLHLVNSHVDQLQVLRGKLTSLTGRLCYANRELLRLRSELASCSNPVT